MRIPKFPNKNDILVFNDAYTVRTQDDQYVDIEKGTLAKVVKLQFFDQSYTDEVPMLLYMAVYIRDELRIIKFDYIAHTGIVSILPDSEATKLLYTKNHK